MQIDDTAPRKSKSEVRVAQIITIAMMAGVLAFAVVAAVMRRFQFDGQPDFLNWIAIGFAGVAFVLHYVVPGILVGTSLREIAPSDLTDSDREANFHRLFPLFQTRHIIACALLEGAAFFNLFAFLQSGYLWSFVAAGVFVVLMATRFPTQASCEEWISDRVREIQERIH